MMNQQEKQFLICALRTEQSDRSISKLRAIKAGADGYDEMVVNDAVIECDRESMQSALNSLAPLVASVRDPEVLRELVSTWTPERTSIRSEYKCIRMLIDSAGWDADHSDNVDEDTRQANFKKREQFTEAAMAIIAVKFAFSVWSRRTFSATLVNTLYEVGALDFVVNGDSYEVMPVNTVRGLFEVIDRWDDGQEPHLIDSLAWPLVQLVANMSQKKMDREQDGNSIVGGDEINAIPKASVKWLVEGMIPKTTEADNPYIGFLYGNSSTYKSFIATGICSAVVRGDRNAAGFAGLAGVDGEPVNILYLSGEDSYGVRERLEVELGERLPVNVRMNLVELDSIYDSTGAFDPAVTRAVIDHNPGLVVMDTMNSLKLCENNNNSAAVSKMMHKIKELGTTVMIIHHSTKGGDSMEGSHAMFSNADFVLRTDVVEREDGIPVVDLSCGKLKNAAKFKTMRIELVDQGDSLVCRNHKAYEDSRGKKWEDMTDYEKVVSFLHDYDHMGASIDEILERLGSDDSDKSYEKERRNLRERMRTWIAKFGVISVVECANVSDKRNKNYTVMPTPTRPD